MRKSGFVTGAVLTIAVASTLAGCGDNAGNPLGYAPEGSTGDGRAYRQSERPGPTAVRSVCDAAGRTGEAVVEWVR